MTTTDPFTEAASAAAEEQWTRDLVPGHPLPGPRRMDRRIGFTMGAGWARDHLEAQEPTEEEVEAAARALVALVHDTAWDHLSEGMRDLNRNDAHAALTAARAALRAARRDEEKRDG